MKKFLLMFLMLIGISLNSYSQSIQWYKATSFAYRTTDYYGNWSSWSDWEYSSVKIKFNTNEDVIVIYSKEIQAFAIYQELTPPYDPTGTQVAFAAYDGDGVKCHIRLRIENNGNSQVYIDYSNLSYCYNVIRTS